MTLDREQKRTLLNQIDGWVKEIKDADHKDDSYFIGHTQLEYTLSKIVDLLLLIERTDTPDYPEKRITVWVGLTEDYPERLDTLREERKDS